MSKLSRELKDLVAAVPNETVQRALRRIIEEMAIAHPAMAQDLVLVIDPTAATPAPTAAAWKKEVTITMKSAGGDVHWWFNGAFTTTASIGDTSTAGTATILSTTLTFVKGVAKVVISGDAAAWLNTETVTLTIANITVLGKTFGSGTCVLTFTTPA